jgi:uncharacterized protein YjbJ (UPF0337 family)
MSDATNDRIEGQIEEVKGRAQKAWGELTNDEENMAEGDAAKAKGKLKKTKADVKDKIDDTVEDLTDR